MDEEFDTSVDTSDVDTSGIDTSDVVDDVPGDIPDDIPEDIPEDIPNDEPESIDEDFSDDIPEDVPDDEPESMEDDLSEEIPEDVADDESESVEDDLSEDIPEDVPEDVPEDESELTEDDLTEDIPEDQDENTSDNDEAATEDVAEETTSETEDSDSTEQTKGTQDEPLDDTATEEATEDTASDVDSSDSTEPIEDTQDEPSDDTATEDATEDTASDVDNADATEPTEDIQDEQWDNADETTDDTAPDIDSADSTESDSEAAPEASDGGNPLPPNDIDGSEGPPDPPDNSYGVCPICGQNPCVCSGDKNEMSGNAPTCPICGQSPCVCDNQTTEFPQDDETQDGPPKVLKRDEFDLLKSGNDAINQRLEAQEDDYRDKGLSEEEIKDRLATDRWNFQKEFLEDAFPGQDVSPNVFNGLSENGSKNRIDEIENSDTLKNQLKKEGTDSISDSIPDTDNQAIEDEGRSEGVSDSSKTMNDVSEDESIKDLRNKFAAFLNKQDITANVPNDTKEVNKDVESAQKMIDDYCNNDLKGVLSDDKKAVRLGDTVEFQDDEDFAKGLGSKERAAGVNGYNNGKKSYVKNSGPHPKKTAIHEHNHQLSCNDTKDALGYVTEYKRGVSINGQDRQVNEALTELFTKKMMGSDYPANPNVGYRDNMLRMEKMESGFGTDVLKEAYYQNKPDLLKSKYESVMGEGSWEPFSKSFDDSLSKYTDQEIFDKREHYRKYGTNLQTATDVKRQNAITYANKCATLFALKSKGVN